MKRFIPLIAMLSVPAMAQDYTSAMGYSQSMADAKAGAVAATVVGTSASGGAGGSASGGNATGGASNATAGSSTSAVNVSGARAAYAPDVLSTPTAPCRVSVGASAGWLGGAFGIGTSVLDDGCNVRETARVLWALGQRDAAIQAMCLDDTAKKALQAVGVVCREAAR
jgi:hypothetical protein